MMVMERVKTWEKWEMSSLKGHERDTWTDLCILISTLVVWLGCSEFEGSHIMMWCVLPWIKSVHLVNKSGHHSSYTLVHTATLQVNPYIDCIKEGVQSLETMCLELYLKLDLEPELQVASWGERTREPGSLKIKRAKRRKARMYLETHVKCLQI